MKPDTLHEPQAPLSRDTKLTTAFRSNNQNLLLGTLAIYVLVLPIAHTIALRGVVFVVLLMVTLALLVNQKRPPRFPLWQAWLMYSAVGLLAVFFAFDPRSSADEFRAEFLYCYAIFMVGSIWGEYFGSFTPFASLLAIANLVLVSFALMFASLELPSDALRNIPAIAYAGLNTNWIMVVLFFHGWLILHLWQQQQRTLPLVLGLLIGLDLWAMMVGYNRQTWLALAVGISCWGSIMLYRKFSWRRVLALALVLGSITLLFSLQLHRRTNIAGAVTPAAPVAVSQWEGVRSRIMKDPRWEIWRFSIEKIREHPLIGGGLGRHVFRNVYPEFQPEQVLHWHSHNMILNKGIQMGIPGMLAFAFLWIALARQLAGHMRAEPKRASLAVAGLSIVSAVFFKNMTDDFFVRDTALMFWLLMGLLLGVLRSTQPTGIQTKLSNAGFPATSH